MQFDKAHMKFQLKAACLSALARQTYREAPQECITQPGGAGCLCIALWGVRRMPNSNDAVGYLTPTLVLNLCIHWALTTCSCAVLVLEMQRQIRQGPCHVGTFMWMEETAYEQLEHFMLSVKIEVRIRWLGSTVCWEREGVKDGKRAGVFPEDKVGNAMSSGTTLSYVWGPGMSEKGEKWVHKGKYVLLSQPQFICR